MLTRAEVETDVRALLAWAERAEALGFDAVFIGDRLLAQARSRSQVVYNGSGLDPLVTLSAIAARTTRLGLGTLIYNVPFRHPIQVAKSFASLDVMSGGRLIFGAGLGWSEAEFAALGIAMRERGRLFEEAIPLLRSLWCGDVVTHRGRWRLDDVQIAPASPMPGGPPIWMASFAPSHSLDFSSGISPAIARALRRVGRLADAWVPMTYSASARRHLSSRDAAAAWALVGAGADEAGRDLSAVKVIQSEWVYVLTDAGSRDRCRRALSAYFTGDWDDAVRTYVIGSADEVAERLAGLSADIGHVDGFVFTPISNEPDQLALLADLRSSVAPVLSTSSPLVPEGSA
nr:TIGR03619 family F420-dependent LLM class oxidoreductase [Nocardioides agariphilus]